MKMDMKKVSIAVAATVSLALCTAVSAAELKLLSAGAVQPGLNIAARIFHNRTGEDATIAYSPATDLGKRVGGGEIADIIIASPVVITALAKAGRVLAEGQVALGRVGVGVAVREGAPRPDISSTQALKAALLSADAVVYNTASSGAYVEAMLKKLGVFDEIEGRLARLFDGNAVMRRLIDGKGREFGFTDIVLNQEKGVRLVGPLPAEIQNYTSYTAAVITAAPNPGGAKAFLGYLASPDGRALFAQNGISD